MNFSIRALLLMMLVWGGAVHAQEGISIEEQGYRVFYSVFNSTMITPEIADVYQLTRDNDLAYVNIVVTEVTSEGQSLGLPAVLSGSATNLMQQKQRLEFKTIEEQNTVYYLAPVSHGNEEVFHFVMAIQPELADKPIELKFTKKMYVE